MSGGSLNNLKESTFSFWRERNARERTMLAIAALVIASGLIYAALIGPALSGRSQLEKELPALRQQAAEMQALSLQAAATPASAAAQPALTKESVEITLASKGLKAQSVVVSGSMIKVQLNSASFAGVVAWLEQMQKSAQLSVVDANILALQASDSVNASLTLRQHRVGD